MRFDGRGCGPRPCPTPSADMNRFMVVFALMLLKAYRLGLSPLLSSLTGPSGGCRFVPTCSRYADEALRRHGFFSGGLLTARRICRCHPWGGEGLDPVPVKMSATRHNLDCLHGS